MRGLVIVFLLLLSGVLPSTAQVRYALGMDVSGIGLSSTFKKSSVAPYKYTINFSCINGMVLASRINMYVALAYQRYGSKSEPLDHKGSMNTSEYGLGVEYLHYKPKKAVTPIIGIKYLGFREKYTEVSTKPKSDKEGNGTVNVVYAGFAYHALPKLFFNGQFQIRNKIYTSALTVQDKYNTGGQLVMGFRFILN